MVRQPVLSTESIIAQPEGAVAPEIAASLGWANDAYKTVRVLQLLQSYFIEE
jgi:hypothetical protein